MSRIGKYPVLVPAGVSVEVLEQNVTATGKRGTLSLRVHDDVCVALEKDEKGAQSVRLSPRGEGRLARILWPTMRTLVRNLVEGVHEGYSKNLEIRGVGYRAAMQGNVLVLSLGYSHEVRYPVPDDVKIELDGQTKIKISGNDKQRVGQVAAEIRAWRKPEPYKGKGIRYENEYVPLKEGKKK